jgi:hypothetical protein
METSSVWYKGCKLDVDWLLQHFVQLQPVKLGRRQGVKCLTCEDNISQAKKVARNGTVPIADGTRELQRIVDHLQGDVHAAALRAEKAKKEWEAQSEKHPWVKSMKKHNADVINVLTRLAIDIHNDSMVKTLSAWSWPSRSLAQVHVDNLIARFSEHGLGTEFMPFKMNDSSCALYRNPDIYKEMLTIISSEQLKSVTESIKTSDCFAIQADKSVDKYNSESLYVTARYMDPTTYQLKLAFLGECHSKLRGADGMVEAISNCLVSCDLLQVAKEKLVGLTTDGESANTGRHGGMWIKLSGMLGRGLLNFWCFAHRSDLALENIEATLPEFWHWKADLKALATYYVGIKQEVRRLGIFCRWSTESFAFPTTSRGPICRRFIEFNASCNK